MITKYWSSTTGKLYIVERTEESWILIDSIRKVVVGKNGLAWGRGLHEQTSSIEKREGDGKAPAGIFKIGEAFGYTESAPEGVNIPYRQASDRDYWIDDANSKDYNLWVSIPNDMVNQPKNYWNSYERMKRPDHLYEYGVIILHNSEPIIPGRGSAIFLHGWRMEDSPTLGCTAMDKRDILRLLKWLDHEKKPILIQIPEAELKNLTFNNQ